MKIPLSLLPSFSSEFPLPKSVRQAVGIDLGTTNSVMATGIWRPEEPEIIDVRVVEIEQQTRGEGVYTDTLVPSFVAVVDGRTWIGEGAKRLVASESGRGKLKNRELFYESKNEIGTNRRYPHAPEGFRSPGEIGGKILAFVKEQASVTPDRLVVTVPASFQEGQRFETTAAAAHAGFDLLRLDLLDEPTAAFIDRLAMSPDLGPFGAKARHDVLIFDFGGGTCDIALLTLSVGSDGLSVSSRSVSRFHRLGGGDIDAAIVYEVLLPQLMQQRGLASTRFGYVDKKRALEPALRPIAESLKIGLCREIERRRDLGIPVDGTLAQIYPATVDIAVGAETFRLTKPSLSLAAFEDVLEPFLDRTILAPMGDEYRLARSIFAPLTDALDLGGLSPSDISVCVMAGGSSNVPQVIEAVQAFLPNARVEAFPNPQDRKLCVARGAAVAATVAAVTGRPLVTPVSHDALVLSTSDGDLSLVEKGTPLPYRSNAPLPVTAPRSSAREPVAVRIEVRRARDGEVLSTRLWSLTPPVRAGEILHLHVSIDTGGVLGIKLARTEASANLQPEEEVRHPLTHVHNPIKEMVEAETLERRLAEPGVGEQEKRRDALKLVGVLDDLGRREQAFDILKAVLRMGHRPDPSILNRMAMIADRIGDRTEARRLYEAASEADPDWAIPSFNLALLLRAEKNPGEATAAIEQSLRRDRTAPAMTLKALIAADQGQEDVKAAALEEARRAWNPVRTLADWELSWFVAWARASGEAERLAEARAEQSSRSRGKPAPEDSGDLPGLAERS